MADDHGHDHTASRHYGRRPDTHGAKRPRSNSAQMPYGVIAYGGIGTGTFLGGAGGGPGQPQGVATAGGISSSSGIDHLSPDQFSEPGGFQTDAGNYTGVLAAEGAEGNYGAGGAPDAASGGVAQ